MRQLVETKWTIEFYSPDELAYLGAWFSSNIRGAPWKLMWEFCEQEFLGIGVKHYHKYSYMVDQIDIR